MQDDDPTLRDRLCIHLTVRRCIVGWLSDCANTLEHMRDGALRKALLAQQRAFACDLAEQDKRIAAVIEGDPDWAERVHKRRTVPAVGPILAHTLIALLPEPGKLS